MIPRAIRITIFIFGLVLFGAVLVVPLGALVYRVAVSWQAPDGGYLPSARQWVLMGRTVGLSACGVLTAMVLALPGAYAVGRFGRVSRAPMLATLLIVPLLLPPMVFSFGWQRLLGAHGPGMRDWGPLLRCVWVWGTWGWPIPALIIGAGWSRVGRAAYEAAILESSGGGAFLRAVLPSLRRHLVVSGLILFVLFVGEYSVPHSNGVIVVATELLTYVQSASMAECLRQSVPMMVLVLSLLVAIRLVWPARVAQEHDERRVETSRPQALAWCAVLAVVVGTAVFPIAALAWRATLVGELFEAFSTYRAELLWSLAICAGVGLVAILIGVLVVGNRWLRWPGVGVVCVAGVWPGAVVGEGVLAAYQSVDVVYNYWPILVIGLAARFAWIGVLSSWVASTAVARDVVSQAAIDGAGVAAARFSVQLRSQWPVLLAGWFVVAAVSLGDVAVVDIVQVPTPRMLATILIEKFHRFETGMLVSMSLLMVACAVPGAILMTVAFRRRS